MTDKNVVRDERKDWVPSEHYQDTSVAESYDDVRFSSFSGRLFNRLEKKTIVEAFRGLVPRGGIIADVPCGTGRIAEALLEAGYRVVGIDVSPAMLAVARKKVARFGDRFEARVADVLDLDDGFWTFDGALCCRVLMHFPPKHQIAFLRKVASLAHGPVVFNHSRITPYQRVRRGAKHLLGKGMVSYALTDADAAELIAGAGLSEIRRRWVLAPLSEAAVFTCMRAG